MPPYIIVIAGPNGAGKSTSAPFLLRDTLGVSEFVNADTIAQGLSAFDPEGAAFAAGRIMLKRLNELAEAKATFAFETTLASRSFAPWLRRQQERGYRVHLVFLWLPSAEFAIQRVKERVRFGGHFVPIETVRRRYKAGLRNFFELYQPLANRWTFYDNTGTRTPRLVASGTGRTDRQIGDSKLWEEVKKRYG